MPFIDTRGIFGPAGKSYSDGRYNDQNDYNTWTDPTVINVDNGINSATGKPFTRADSGFGSYTSRADANGKAEAARQAAADSGGLFGNPILDAIGQAAAAYFGGPIGAGLYGTAASGGDIGKGLLAAGMTYAGGQLTGTGSGATGGSWYSPSGDIGNIFGGTGVGTIADVGTGVGSINPSLTESFNSMYSPSAWANTAGGSAALGMDQVAAMGTNTAGGNVGILDDLTSWYEGGAGSGPEAMWDTASTAAGDVTGTIAQLEQSVANGSMTLEEAMAQMQAANDAASGGNWTNFLNSGAIGDPMLTGAGQTGFFDNLLAQAKADPLGSAAKAVKSLFGGTAAAGGGGSLLGAGLGGLAGLLGGSKQAGTTDTTQTPWGPQQPFLLDAWNKAKTASETTNPLQTQANSNFQSVLQGPTTNPMLGMDNPYLTKAIDNANSDVTRAMMPAVNQANKASGSFGNSGVADQYGKAMTDAYSRNANDMRFKDYTNQQQLQQSAVGNTLGFTTGASQFNSAPAQNYAKTVQGNYGGTTSSPYFTNNANSMLGGATLGYKLFGGN